MSVLVKGLQMPANCGSCPFRLAWCRERIYMVTRPQRCPLVELPDHGDLIDRDALMKHEGYVHLPLGNLPVIFMSYVKGAPVVIPAERSEE